MCCCLWPTQEVFLSFKYPTIVPKAFRSSEDIFYQFSSQIKRLFGDQSFDQTHLIKSFLRSEQPLPGFYFTKKMNKLLKNCCVMAAAIELGAKILSVRWKRRDRIFWVPRGCWDLRVAVLLDDSAFWTYVLKGCRDLKETMLMDYRCFWCSSDLGHLFMRI